MKSGDGASNVAMNRETSPGPGRDRLLTAALDGSEQAFDSLFGPLVEPGYRLALVMLRSPEEAEDAVQEAVFKAWRHLHRLKDDHAIRSWFLSIVANECRSRRRLSWWRNVPLPNVVMGTKDVEESAIRAADLASAFARLGREERLVIHLFFSMDLPLEEVAAAMGTSVPAARSRLYRAVKRMRPDVELSEMLS
jgi:RNA polymerase sigma-70 factor, ECF subfamily